MPVCGHQPLDSHTDPFLAPPAGCMQACRAHLAQETIGPDLASPAHSTTQVLLSLCRGNEGNEERPQRHALPYPAAAPAACCPLSGTRQLPLHTPKTALFGPSHTHTISMAPCPKGRLELGQVLHNPGVRPQPHKVGSGRGAGGGLQGGTSSWPGTPGLCRAAWLEGQARFCQSTESTVGVPLPGSQGCSGRALCSVKNFLSQGWPGHSPAQNLLTGPHCPQEELNLLFEPIGYSLPLIILSSAVPCYPRALPRALATPPPWADGVHLLLSLVPCFGSSSVWGQSQIK